MLAAKKQDFPSKPEAIVFDWRGTLYVPRFNKNPVDCVSSATRELLAFLKRHNVWMGICSNLEQKQLVREVQATQLFPLFKNITGTSQNSPIKPDPRLLWTCLSHSPHPPGENVWFVGDMPIDAQCALKAGLTPVTLGTNAPVFSEEVWLSNSVEDLSAVLHMLTAEKN